MAVLTLIIEGEYYSNEFMVYSIFMVNEYTLNNLVPLLLFKRSIINHHVALLTFVVLGECHTEVYSLVYSLFMVDEYTYLI